jgi:prolyl oligopeptidase
MRKPTMPAHCSPRAPIAPLPLIALIAPIARWATLGLVALTVMAAPVVPARAMTPTEGGSPVATPAAPAVAAPAAPSPDGAAARLPYPQTRTVEHVDEYHGQKIADPYRWLEDPDAEDTRAWVEAENRVTFGYLESIAAREPLRRRLTELWNYERYGVPYRQGGRYFFSKNDGLQNQSVIYTLEKLDGTPRVLIDPNTLSSDGTIALSGYSVSEDGSRVAYGLSSGGSDWEEWRVREVATGRDLEDRLQWVKFSGASWTHDGLGFFYSRYDEPEAGQKMEQANYYQKLYYHRVGTPQSADRLVYQRPDQKELGFQGFVTEDGRYLVIHVWKGTEVENGIAYMDLTAPDSPTPQVTKLLDGFDASYLFLGNDGPVFWFQTNDGAPRGRVIAVDTRQPARERWREVIPQAAETLEAVNVVHDSLIVQSLKDAHSQVKVYGLDGKLRREVALPGLGSAGGFGGKRKDRETFYSFTSFTDPGTIYRYDVETGASTVFRQPKVAFDPAQFQTDQVFFTSKDGTRVPMFVVHRKGLQKDGRNPVLLYGYGGFNISLTPSFSVSNLVWMERGGVLAIPNLRGGGEYGEDWHLAGSKLHKQNTFDDFFAAAEFLIRERYTAPQRIAISGRSNGGLLVGAALTQRPELFGAAVVGVGVLDMLRFHKFTIGWGWVSDYGSPDDPQEFKALYAYSPYHNIKPGTAYPATLITTADHDDRVVPAHSFKFAAALQKAQGGPEPVLIRIETRAGHGAGKPTSKKIEEAADELSFMVRELGVEEGRAPLATGR